MSLSIALLGFTVGAFVGLSGVGAGVIMAPILVLLGTHPHIAIGTDLAYSAVTKLVASARNAALRLVDMRWLLRLLGGSLPGAVVGAEFTRLLPPGRIDSFLQTALGAVLILASAGIVAKEVLATGNRRLPGPDLLQTRPWAVTAAAAVIGFLVGLTSIGSGSLFMLLLITFSRLSPREAVATDIANAAALTLVAGALQWSRGTVDASLAGNLLLGSIPGILLGSQLAGIVPARPLKCGIALLIMASGLKLVL